MIRFAPCLLRVPGTSYLFNVRMCKLYAVVESEAPLARWPNAEEKLCLEVRWRDVIPYLSVPERCGSTRYFCVESCGSTFVDVA